MELQEKTPVREKLIKNLGILSLSLSLFFLFFFCTDAEQKYQPACTLLSLQSYTLEISPRMRWCT